MVLRPALLADFAVRIVSGKPVTRHGKSRSTSAPLRATSLRRRVFTPPPHLLQVSAQELLRGRMESPGLHQVGALDPSNQSEHLGCHILQLRGAPGRTLLFENFCSQSFCSANDVAANVRIYT